MTDAAAPPIAAPPDARTRILDAAEALVRQHGVARLTLEAAARAAGVSKGGLLYHFASKEALLAAMMARLAATIRATFAEALDTLPPGPHPTARGLLAFALSLPAREADGRIDRMAAVLMAAHHHDPALLEPVRAEMRAIRARMAEEGTPPGIAAAAMAVKDGVMLARIFHFYDLSEAERDGLRRTMAGLLAGAP
jgi:AcrR family transcriptional regulator